MLIGSSLPDMRELTHISLFISLEPNVEIPTFDTNGLECIELEQTKARIYLWFEEYRNEFPQRARLPLVTLLSGKRVCITRLLGPVNVPFVLDETVERMIRRYVALVPVYYNTDACSQLSGVWLTNKVKIAFILEGSVRRLCLIPAGNPPHDVRFPQGLGRAADLLLPQPGVRRVSRSGA